MISKLFYLMDIILQARWCFCITLIKPYLSFEDEDTGISFLAKSVRVTNESTVSDYWDSWREIEERPTSDNKRQFKDVDLSLRQNH